MKKTVSINIGGIIFHAEEDGYEKLKNYLDSVNKYFSSFEDSNEIIADIENRIAEIFLSRLAEGRQTITLEDVDDLIATMGTTRDFEATIETEPPTTEKEASDEDSENVGSATPPEAGYKRLYRDTKRRILGGVASGIAYYFSIDPLWIRLLFIALFVNVFMGGLSGATFLAYIILWIVLPPNEKLEEDKKVKKLFRNSEERVLGGVASGIASYFGTDIAVIRLLFVLSIFLGGAGILIYIILWIITPEARSLTEKMQMQGKPVTLSNIEDNVKKGLNVKEGEESPWVKVLLFPFRLIALVINGLGRILGPLLKFLAELIRIAFGALLVIIGFFLMFGIVVGLFGVSGIGIWPDHVVMGDFPIDLLRRSLDTWPVVSLFLVSFIPALAMTLLGLVVILKRRVANAYVGWSLFSLWILALIISSFTIPSFVRQFTSEDEIRVDKTFQVTEATPVLKLNETGYDTFDKVQLRLRGHEDSVYQLIQTVSSRGRDRNDAEENALAVIYNVKQQGDDLYFDSDITFPDSVEYRFQEVDMTLYIPYGKVFRMDGDLEDILINTLHMNGYRSYQIEDNDWVFERDGLRCTTCAPRRSDDATFSRSSSGGTYSGADEISYPFEDFDEVRISSYFDVEITRGDSYSIRVKGDDDDLDEVYLNQVGDRLEVKYKEDNWKWWSDRGSDKVGVFIIMPELEYLQLVGDCDGEVRGFATNKMTFELTGSSDLLVRASPRDMEVKLTGASKAQLVGEAEKLQVDLIGASEFNGFDFKANDVEVNAIGASKAEIYGYDRIDITAAGASKVEYRGTDNVRIEDAGFSTIRRD